MVGPWYLAVALAAALDPDGAAALTGAVVTAAAASPRIEVVSAADVKQAIAVEAQRQLVGCAADDSCLTEIANALGANLVLHGTYGELDGEMFVTLQLFDSRTAVSGGRVVSRAADLAALRERIIGDVRAMMADFVAREDTGVRAGAASGAPVAPLRVLVLDLDPTGTASPSPSSPSSFLFGPGVTLAAVGVVAVGAGVLTDLFFTAPANARALDKQASTQEEALAAFAERDTWGAVGLSLTLGGASAIIVGGALLLLSIPETGAP